MVMIRRTSNLGYIQPNRARAGVKVDRRQLFAPSSLRLGLYMFRCRGLSTFKQDTAQTMCVRFLDGC